MSKKHLAEYEEKLKQKQLESWSRWVSCMVIYRRLKDNPPDWFEWLEKQLEGTHYTMTEETYKEIKQRYERTKRLYY
jgi:hypothetical protein